MNLSRRHLSGFTIVELLIVIVVIAILASISVVAYNGIQARGRDSQRRSDVAAISKVLQLYKINTGTMMEAGSGCGYNGNGSGWFNYTGVASPGWPSYPTSIYQCIENAGVINKEILDPSGMRICNGYPASECFTYMKYTCSQGTFVYAHLESLPLSSTAADASCAPNYDTEYGMNYVVKVE